MAKPQSFALVFEDTELGRWALRRALEAEGLGVEVVSTWAEASRWLHQMKFSMAFVAVSSAPGSAADVVADIRRDFPDTRLVLLAGQDSIDELRLACGPGPEILAKPLDLDAVARVARSCPGLPGPLLRSAD
jgi:ActR/RegA family two-component response regulator